MTPVFAPTVSESRHATELITLLFTDMAGSTALKQQLGDRLGAALFDQHHQIVRDILAQAHGQEIETAGDSFLIVFKTPSDAVKFAVLLQARLRYWGQSHGIRALDRVGIHVGEVVIKGPGSVGKPRDLYGIQIDTCARVMSLAKSGQTLMTRAVFDSARQVLKGEDIEGVGALEWLSHGPFLLKGIEEAVEVCEVRETGQSTAGPPTSSEKAQRQVLPDQDQVLGWRPALGQTVPNTRWRLEKRLGEGGFGEVWLGRNPTTKEPRVFKFCFRGERVRFLKRELTLFRLLKERVGEHPNIVRLHDVYLDQPPFYVEMDYVEGADLRSWCLARGGVGQVPLETRLEIVAQVAEALQAAHEAGVIHRDVKPANILIAESGTSQPATAGRGSAFGGVKLTDFGIGQVVSEEYLRGITRAGFTETMLADSSSSRTGTQLYMAPELLQGRPATIRSDVYALGVVLYQLLVEDFSQPVTTDWARHVDDALLREDLQHCFAGDPQDRFAAALLLARNLRRLPERRQARERELAEQSRRERAAYRRGIIRTGVVAAVVLGVLALLALVAVRQSRRARASAEESRQRLVTINVANGVRLLEDGDAYGALPWLVEGLRWDRGRPEQELPHRVRIGAIQLEGRQLAWMFFREQPVSAAEFSPDGRLLVLAAGQEAQVWDLETGRTIGTPLRHEAAISTVRFSRTGRWLATAGADKIAGVWDPRTGRALAHLQHSGPVYSTAFSPDETLVATGSEDSARIWRLPAGEPVGSPLKHVAVVDGIQFSPDGAKLSTQEIGKLWIWDVPTAGLLSTRPVTVDFLTLGFTPDSRQLLVVDRTGRIWDAITGDTVSTLRSSSGFSRAVLTPNAAELITAASDGVVRVWSVKTGAALSGEVRSGPNPTLLSPDGSCGLVSGGNDLVRAWNALTGKPLTPLLRHGSAVTCSAFSPGSDRFVTADSDGVACVWDLIPAEPPLELTHTQAVWHVAVSHDGHKALTTGAAGAAQVWDLQTGARLGAPMQHSRGVAMAEFRSDDQQVVTASYDGTARVWSAAQGTPLGPPLRHKEGVLHATFSPDGRRIATASHDRCAIVWDAVTGQEMARFAHPREVQHVSFSPDGTRLLTACRDGAARVWDLGNGRLPLRVLQHDDWVLGAWFSQDGTEILTASNDGTARLWTAVTGAWRHSFRHHGPVYTACFSPEQKRILTASQDGKAVIWDRGNGQAATAPLRHAGAVVCARFSGDGRIALTASADATARLWDATTGQPLSPEWPLPEGARDAVPTADGGRFVVASGNVARVYRLPKAEQSVEALGQLATVFSRQRFDGANRSVSSPAIRLRQAWESVSSGHIPSSAIGVTKAEAWHRGRLAEAQRAGQWPAARFHLDQLAQLKPGDPLWGDLRNELERRSLSNRAPDPSLADFADFRAMIPPRDPSAPLDLIDLSEYYTSPMMDIYGLHEFSNPSSLPRGIQIFSGIRFDVRGLVLLSGTGPSRMGLNYPPRAEGLLVGRKCRRLHFLHGTMWTEAVDCVIAKYVLHLAGGQRMERAVRYGADVRNWWDDGNETPGARVAWRGANAQRAGPGNKFRFYTSVWENPHPDLSVEAIDFVSTGSDCAPFLIAITAE